MSKKKQETGKKTGTCYLVGAGPGDPGLITLRAKQCVEAADVIVYDHLSNPAILRWAKPGAEFIYAGKRVKDHSIPQGGINKLIIQEATDGKTVVRLKGGDPFLFGRGGEEARELRAGGIPFEVVPGVTSAIAGPAYAGIPVTHRTHASQLTIFTGHQDPEKDDNLIDYAGLAASSGTKVMLMGVAKIGAVTAELSKHGMAADTPVALVRWATTGRQETLTGTLDTIAKRVKETGFSAPAVAIFGGVVELREELNWFEDRPLFGKRIVITRNQRQAGTLGDMLRELGADAFQLPTIRFEPPEDETVFSETVEMSHTYDWIIFTSPNGVESFFEVFYSIYDDAREIGGARIAAVGPATAEKLRSYHIATDLMPESNYVAEGLIEAFDEESIENLTVLWVRPESARPVIADELANRGAIVDEAIAYRTVPETRDISGGIARFKEDGADVITFTSSSTVENFLNLQLPLPENLKIASIGPITTDTLKKAGLYVDIEAEEHTIPGLVAAIRKYFESESEEG